MTASPLPGLLRDRAPDDSADGADPLAAVLARVAALEAAVDRLVAAVETGRGPRDQADEQVLRAIVEAAGFRFTAAEMVRHASVSPALEAALAAADIDNAIQLGLLLRRLVGARVDDLTLERTGERDRDGWVYRWRQLRE